MSVEDEARRLLEIAQSDSDTDDPEVADLRRWLADAELRSIRYHHGLITREQAAKEGMFVVDVPEHATDEEVRIILRAQMQAYKGDDAAKGEN